MSTTRFLVAQRARAPRVVDRTLDEMHASLARNGIHFDKRYRIYATGDMIVRAREPMPVGEEVLAYELRSDRLELVLSDYDGECGEGQCGEGQYGEGLLCTITCLRDEYSHVISRLAYVIEDLYRSKEGR